MSKPSTPQIIKFAAVATVAPRWIIAFLAAEGLVIPSEWERPWLVISAILAATFAVTEGWGFSYAFERWADMRKNDKNRNVVLGFAIASAIVFVLVLIPSMASSVSGVTVGEYLQHKWLINLWTGCIGLSAMLIVVTVGLAQDKSERTDVDPKLDEARKELRETKKELSSATEVKEALDKGENVTSEQLEKANKPKILKE